MRGNLGGVSADHGDFAPGAARGTRTGTGASGFALGAGPLDMGRGGSRGDGFTGARVVGRLLSVVVFCGGEMLL